MKSLNERQQGLLNKISDDGGWHAAPYGTSSQTIFSLIRRGLLKSKMRPHVALSRYYGFNYTTGFLFQRTAEKKTAKQS